MRCRHEIRKDDRGYNVGGTLVMKEWDEQFGVFTGRWVHAEVTYLTRGPEWGVPEGMVVMSVHVGIGDDERKAKGVGK